MAKSIKQSYEQESIRDLVMGRQLHIGGSYTSWDLASKACIKPYMTGLDLGCNNGETMRFLVRNFGIKSITGIDISESSVQKAKYLSKQEGFDNKQTKFIVGDINKDLSTLNTFDFVWSNDTFCYIKDKQKLFENINKILKPEGLIIFSDWIKGNDNNTINNTEYNKYLNLMSFPNNLSINEYKQLMIDNDFEIIYANKSGKMIECLQLYVDMLNKQFRYDAMRIINYDLNRYNMLLDSYKLLLQLSKKKIFCHGLFIAKKKNIQSKL